jgi:hypothetical protein
MYFNCDVNLVIDAYYIVSFEALVLVNAIKQRFRLVFRLVLSRGLLCRVHLAPWLEFNAVSCYWVFHCGIGGKRSDVSMQVGKSSCITYISHHLASKVTSKSHHSRIRHPKSSKIHPNQAKAPAQIKLNNNQLQPTPTPNPTNQSMTRSHPKLANS